MEIKFLLQLLGVVGVVSAARATTRLIPSVYKDKKVDFIIFTGVAGSANNKLKQWDIVVLECMMQHDMDARPIYKKFVIPALVLKNLSQQRFT